MLEFDNRSFINYKNYIKNCFKNDLNGDLGDFRRFVSIKYFLKQTA